MEKNMFNNIFETDEERQKRLLQQTQPTKPMEQMSTREALEYAWDQSEAKNKAMENQNQNTNFIMPPERKPRYAELNFDGEKLDWVENDQIKKSWTAMSGNPEYQNAEATSIPDKGPLPQGDWNVPQKNLENFADLSPMKQKLSRWPLGTWPNGIESWGNHRIKLEPAENTNTFGRKNIYMHGGAEFGSRGCLDLEQNMDDFTEEYKKYGRDMLMRVKYPKKFW